MTLRHVGFLGGMPPAVKGLADYAFSDANEPICFEFMDWQTADGLNSVGRLFRKIKDWIISQSGVESADAIIPEYEIDMLKEKRATPEPEQVSAPAFSEGGNMPEVEDLKAEIAKLTQQVQEFSEKVTALETENGQLKTEAANQKAEAVKNELNSFCDGLIKEGKMRPADKEMFVEQLIIANDASQRQFAEGEKTPVQKLRDTLASMPKVVEFGEMKDPENKGDVPTDAKSVAQRALQYQEEQARNGVVISITQAVEHISK